MRQGISMALRLTAAPGCLGRGSRSHPNQLFDSRSEEDFMRNGKLSTRSNIVKIFIFVCALTLTMIVISAPAVAQTETVLYSFNGYGTGGAAYQPYSGVILDSSGNIYGTTFEGGTFGH